jgi:hypothetical protein
MREKTSEFREKMSETVVKTERLMRATALKKEVEEVGEAKVRILFSNSHGLHCIANATRFQYYSQTDSENHRKWYVTIASKKPPRHTMPVLESKIQDWSILRNEWIDLSPTD